MPTAPTTARSAASRRPRAAAPKPAPAQPAQSDGAESREDRIRKTAYALFEQRGGVDGHALDDWVQAEAAVDGAGPAQAAGHTAAQP